MNFTRAEKYRANHPLIKMGFNQHKGADFGWFEIPFTIQTPLKRRSNLRVMVAPSDSKWQHISVSLINRCPTWDEMCFIKDMFFGGEDVVVQYHPAKSKYVNNMPYCLHLWCLNDGSSFPTPPPELVGLKND